MGSEMCIRDRAIGLAWVQKRGKGKVRGGDCQAIGAGRVRPSGPSQYAFARCQDRLSGKRLAWVQKRGTDKVRGGDCQATAAGRVRPSGPSQYVFARCQDRLSGNTGVNFTIASSQ